VVITLHPVASRVRRPEQYPLTLHREAIHQRMKLLANLWLDHDPPPRIMV
jgi:hypothetical protein